MLVKLSLAGIKSKRGDYIVLLAGLVLSVSIFYMFQTLAWNTDFIQEHSVINHIRLVFMAGAVLLSAVTFFYSMYTNSFLLSLRQREFGMYMVLGAKKRKLAKLMFVETVAIGTASMALGIALGVVLAQAVGYMLMRQVGFVSGGYYPLYWPSVCITIAFFSALFLVSGLMNRLQLSRLPVLQLLYADVKTERAAGKGRWNVVMAAVGLVALGIGYFALVFMEYLREVGLLLATGMTTLGTYLCFASLLPVWMNMLKRNKRLNARGIQSFTLAQLGFRIRGLTKLLATVAMLIALGAGAISGGMAFQNNAELKAEQYRLYDVTIHNPTSEERDILKGIDFSEMLEYRYKVENKTIYYLSDDLDSRRPLVQAGSSRKDRHGERLSTPVPVSDNAAGQTAGSDGSRSDDAEWSMFVWTLQPAFPDIEERRIVDAESFQRTDVPEQVVFIGKTDRFTAYADKWRQLDRIKEEKYDTGSGYSPDSKYEYYEKEHLVASGTVFMGMFLGIAFLAMMASSLMFKVLSGAVKDMRRYRMLRKIGVRRDVLSRSIYKEMFLVFLFPAAAGLAHVLVGMNLFSFILLNPYDRIWIPIAIFLFIYAMYYWLTVMLYRKVVLPEEA